MGIRVGSRRLLIGLAAVVGLLLVAPAGALATGESLSITPTTPTFSGAAASQANGSPSFTDVVGLNSTEAAKGPSNVAINLAPGLLLNLSADTSCLASVQDTGTTCQIGDWSSASGASEGSLYLVPAPAAGDVAGVEAKATSGSMATFDLALQFLPSNNGAATVSTTLPQNVDDLFLNISDTLNGNALSRMPTSCPTTPANNSMSVTYSDSSTGTATSPLTVTGCSSLTYSPSFTSSGVKDPSDAGVALHTVTTFGATDAASSTIKFLVPLSQLQPNGDAAAIACFDPTFNNCTPVGTSSMTSPLNPVTLSGKAYLTLYSGLKLTVVLDCGTPTATNQCPASNFPVQLNGAIDVNHNTLTFSNVADLPISNLTVNLTGGPHAAFTTSCASPTGTTAVQYTAQTGAFVQRLWTNTIAGCPGPPTASGSVSGLASGHPKFSFNLKRGKNAPNISSVAVKPPSGMSFKYVTQRKCTGTGKHRKCKTTKVIKGLSISGGSARSETISGGKLLISLRSPTGSLSVTTSGPLLSETTALKNNVKKHKVKFVTFDVFVTDSGGKQTTLPLTLPAK